MSHVRMPGQQTRSGTGIACGSLRERLNHPLSADEHIATLRATLANSTDALQL